MAVGGILFKKVDGASKNNNFQKKVYQKIFICRGDILLSRAKKSDIYFKICKHIDMHFLKRIILSIFCHGGVPAFSPSLRFRRGQVHATFQVIVLRCQEELDGPSQHCTNRITCSSSHDSTVISRTIEQLERRFFTMQCPRKLLEKVCDTRGKIALIMKPRSEFQ